jgi:hypothetical protein
LPAPATVVLRCCPYRCPKTATLLSSCFFFCSTLPAACAEPRRGRYPRPFCDWAAAVSFPPAPPAPPAPACPFFANWEVAPCAGAAPPACSLSALSFALRAAFSALAFFFSSAGVSFSDPASAGVAPSAEDAPSLGFWDCLAGFEALFEALFAAPLGSRGGCCCWACISEVDCCCAGAVAADSDVDEGTSGLIGVAILNSTNLTRQRKREGHWRLFLVIVGLGGSSAESKASKVTAEVESEGPKEEKPRPALKQP